MVFHVINLPHTICSKEYNACAYTQKVYKFCLMMKSLGHKVILYAHPDSTAPRDELVPIISKKEHREFFGDNDWRKEFFKIEWSNGAKYFRLINERAKDIINKTAKKGDFVALITGTPHKDLIDKLDLSKVIPVEYGIGYRGVYAKYKVFESYAQMHHVYSIKSVDTDGEFYDAVIPNYFDPDDFRVAENPTNDYYLYLGRMIKRKGVYIASETVRRIGGKLKLAGQGIVEHREGYVRFEDGTELEGEHIEYVGYADVTKRRELMANAIATFVPTYYLEPFGGVSVESLMCGTPIITTDWGAFPEINQHGDTGYRCRTLAEFIRAAEMVKKLDRNYIRKYAVSNYSLDRVARMYDHYFKNLLQLWDKGWYNEIQSYDEDLEWLNRYN